MMKNDIKKKITLKFNNNVNCITVLFQRKSKELKQKHIADFKAYRKPI